MVIQSYQYAFKTADGRPLPIATARGGNIIGGGDWSEDRLVPDFVRAVVGGSSLTLRYPDATRPWQHVLALVQGYLMLASRLIEAPERVARSWNLGPTDGRVLTVRSVLETLAATWTRPKLDYLDNPAKEAQLLALDSTLARDVLDWHPAWDVDETIVRTADWYRDFYARKRAASEITQGQLDDWRQLLLGRLRVGA
jgi:CDP-glucose 4,6-dehydratase